MLFKYYFLIIKCVDLYDQYSIAGLERCNEL